MAANKKCCRNIDWCVGKKQLFCKLWFAGLACSGLQMCCFVGIARSYQRSTNPINLLFVIV